MVDRAIGSEEEPDDHVGETGALDETAASERSTSANTVTIDADMEEEDSGGNNALTIISRYGARRRT